MMEKLQIGDRVFSNDLKRYRGTVLKVGVGMRRDMVEVQLDPNGKFPPAMSLKVGGFERSWIRIDEK